MIDYPPHRRGINEGQEDYDDRVSNPTDTEIAAYERWMVKRYSLFAVIRENSIVDL